MNRIPRLTLYVLACILAAACLLSIPACDAPVTQPEAEQIEALDARIDQAKAALDALEVEAKDQAVLLADGDPANDQAAVEKLEQVHADYMRIGDALQADLAARGKIISQAADRATQPVAGGLAALFPQWSPLILAGGALASRLVTKRSRDHLLDSFKALGRAQLGDFVGGLLRSLGYTHSNTDPVKVLEGAKVAAEKQGDPDEADRIAKFAAALKANRALKRAGADGLAPEPAP